MLPYTNIKPEELLADTYLRSLALGTPVYQPDGNIPPDFSINGQIAIEVRRLNENCVSNNKTEGLERVDIPLYIQMRRLLKSYGPARSGRSVVVSYKFRRPIARWKTLESLIKRHLQPFETEDPPHRMQFDVHESLSLDIAPLSSPMIDRFYLAVTSDQDSGGMLLDLLRRNLVLVIQEKTGKVAPYRQKYSEWWLVLVDYIGFGLDDFERELFRQYPRIPHGWDRVVLIDPRDPRRSFDV